MAAQPLGTVEEEEEDEEDEEEEGTGCCWKTEPVSSAQSSGGVGVPPGFSPSHQEGGSKESPLPAATCSRW